MNVNKIIISGRLTKDPELKEVSGTDLCSFRIASNRVVGKNKVEKSVFIDVSTWAGQAKVCHKFLKKGSRVIIDGTLCQDSWEDKDGKSNTKTYIDSSNVIFLDEKNNATQQENYKKESDFGNERKQKENNEEESFDEDLPF